MSIIHIKRIQSALTKLYGGKIDQSDIPSGVSDADREVMFLSRALSAYTISVLSEAGEEAAAASVTDGFDDNGIDAIFFDQARSVLYVVQSKWIANGRGALNVADCKKFVDGFRDLVSLRLDPFNQRIRSREAELRIAMYDSNVTFVLVTAHTGEQGESEHVTRDLDALLSEMNSPEDVVSLERFGQQRLYSAVSGHAQRHSISLDIMLHDWGCIEEPYLAYYGQADAAAIWQWWNAHSRDLFARNIRNFKGSTDVNASILGTLSQMPQHFWYFNNGVTILCSSVKKRPVGGSSRDTGVFDCQGISVVNGAQTVGIIGGIGKDVARVPESARVLVRLISLEGCPEGFDKELARATNTQNRIEHRDFASLDPNQQRLASEMRLDGKYYAFRSGDQESSDEDGCTLVDATIALACACPEMDLSVQAKREIGRLWENIEGPPYTTLFNDRTDAKELWRAVQIMRAVDKALKRPCKADLPRAGMVGVHGNRFLLHRVFQDPQVKGFRDPAQDLNEILDRVDQVTEKEFTGLASYLEENYPNAYLASFFKNHQRCRAANSALAEVGQKGEEGGRDGGDGGTQGTLFA